MAVLLSKESRVTFDGVLDYSFSNFHDCLSLGPEALDMLKLDCQEAFTCRSILNSDESYSSGSTYFIKSNYAPRCQLEQLALSIFQLHTKDAIFSAELSGAEWWTQVIDCRDDIGFHWDRDYGLEEDTGQHIHPHLATVTYLTDLGGPTLILNKVGTRHATECLSGTADEIIISRPMFGKHIKFDGRLLHAAPCDLLELEDESFSDEQGDDSEEDSSDSDSSSTSSDIEIPEPTGQTYATADEITRRSSNGSGSSEGSFSDIKSKEEKNSDDDDDDDNDDDDAGFPKRITFLVNIWLNHIPIQSSEFPADRLCNMQILSNLPQLSTSFKKLDYNRIIDDSVELSVPSDEKVSPISFPSIELSSTINLSETTETLHNDNESHDKYLYRKWKFSNSGMKYNVTVPLPPINRLQSLAIDHDAFRLLYNTSGVSARVDRIMSKKRKAMQKDKNNTSS